MMKDVKPGIAAVSVDQFDCGLFKKKQEFVTTEEPLQISLNQTPYTLTMRTPGHDLELATGLMISEGLCSKESELRCEQNGLNAVNLTIDPTQLIRPRDRTRNIASYSSCGMCGQVELSDLDIQGESLQERHFVIGTELLSELFSVMNSFQEGYKVTGGTHAAAAFTQEGQHLVTREDLGRHNAVDKVIGFLSSANALDQADILLVSSRASYEIVAKAYRVRIPIVAVISAVSSLAVSTAEQNGLTLVGFCRDKRATIYSHPQRISLGEASHV
jgi:FdhD protein